MTFDLIIRGGSVVDGTGGPARTADVAVPAGRIAEIGRIKRSTGTASIERGNDRLVPVPGFQLLPGDALVTGGDGQISGQAA